jgi:hypothetical protein
VKLLLDENFPRLASRNFWEFPKRHGPAYYLDPAEQDIPKFYRVALISRASIQTLRPPLRGASTGWWTMPASPGR